jgi:serine phosphatase RsbU (regulator of sigma subunit)/Tfp pilus assembly protein PilF
MKTLVTTILFIFSIAVFSQTESESNYIKLSEKLITASDEEKAELYCKLSNLFLDSIGNKSMIFAQNSLKYANIKNNTEDIVRANLQIASVFMSQSNWDKALEYLSVAEKDINKVQDLILIHSIYNQFGMIYKFTGQHDLAMEYYHKGLNIARQNKNSNDIIFALNNIGTIYILQNKYDAALQIFESAEKECLLSNNQGKNLAAIYNNVGYIYFVTENYVDARSAWNKSINCLDLNKDFHSNAVLLNNLAELEIKTGNFEQAEANIKAAESIHQKHNYKESRKNLYYTSYQLFFKVGKYHEAISYLNKYIELKDSIYTEELSNNVSKLKADYDFVKLENESIIKDNKIVRKNFISKILILVIISITAFIVLLFSILVKIKKLNLKLKSINSILKVKNEEIDSNLQYAKLIQVAITSNNETIPNLVLFDQPKFGVGGDFFMNRKLDNNLFLILGDCTGHGTSGAILSVFAISTINKLLSSQTSPEKIVNNLNLNFLNYITKSDNLKNESLTISILCVQNSKVFYAGSRQKVWHFCEANKTLSEFKTDSFLIGQEMETSFNLKSFEVYSGDVLFMASDGFADQFGDADKGKYKYDRFRQMLVNWASQGIHETTYLEKELSLWQGKAEQTDDIMVMAIKI